MADDNPDGRRTGRSVELIEVGMNTKHNPVRYEDWMGEDRCWVCPHCDAELDADSVSDECPNCGTQLNDE